MKDYKQSRVVIRSRNKDLSAERIATVAAGSCVMGFLLICYALMHLAFA